MKPDKQRLDQIMVARCLAASRERARALIREGAVLVNGLPATKPGSIVPTAASVTLKQQDIPYVSRGGLKLEKALDAFRIAPADAVCLDIGASTGGFTDCLLQRGARRVYAVDVGYGQLAWKLRQDSRVIPIERTNARHIDDRIIPEKVDLATVDVSFISLRLIVPAVLPLMKPKAWLIPLIKPQFEVGKGQVGKGGVVKDRRQHENVILSLQEYFEAQGLACAGVVPSPILGPKGNREFLALLRRGIPMTSKAFSP